MFTIQKWSKLAILSLMFCFVLSAVVVAANVNNDTQAPTVSSDPGDKVIDIKLPVSAFNGLGIECGLRRGLYTEPEDLVLYYTNVGEPKLYMTNCAGGDLGFISLLDKGTGTPISFGAITWDSQRKVLWGGTNIRDHNPVKVYIIHVGLDGPPAGQCDYQFTLGPHPVQQGFCDGIAYDQISYSIYVSDDANDWIEHWHVGGGTPTPLKLGPDLIPPNPAGTGPLNFFSGLLVDGTGTVLYLGTSVGGIYKWTIGAAKSTLFSAAPFHVEDLTCEDICRPPDVLILARDAFGSHVIGILAEPNACKCISVPTLSQWGLIIFGSLMLSYLSRFVYRRRKLTTPTAFGIFLLLFSIAFFVSYTI